MGYRDDGNNSTRKRRDKTRECGDRFGGTAGTGVDLCQWLAFDSDDDVDADDNLIIDPDPALTTVHASTVP
jgi:hypothetical protein